MFIIPFYRLCVSHHIIVIIIFTTIIIIMIIIIIVIIIIITIRGNGGLCLSTATEKRYNSYVNNQ